jgi:hypothetical protein
MTEQEKKELRMLGLDPQMVYERMFSAGAKPFNPAKFIGSQPLTDSTKGSVIAEQEALLGPEGTMTLEEKQAMKKAMLERMMSR